MEPFFLVILAGGLFATDISATPRAQALHTPSEIAPAVTPYLACLLAARGSPLYGTTGQKVAPETGPVGSDCSPTRSKAAQDALQLLRSRKNAGGEAAEAIVNRTLSDMDEFAASLTGVAPGIDPQQAVPAVTISLEDEVVPAFERYFDCLSSSLRGSKISPGNATERFRQAMDFCRETRASSLILAEQALAAKGWNPHDCRKAAIVTFEQADRLWTSMARPIQQSQ